MTQMLFDLTYLERFLERLGGASPIPLLVGVWPITSLELAVRVHNETPGIVVPEHVQERYRAAGADAAAWGRQLARELVARARELAAGVYVVAPFRRPLGVLDRAAGLIRQQLPVETGAPRAAEIPARPARPGCR